VLQAHDLVRGNGKVQIPRNLKRNEYDNFSEYRQGIDSLEKVNFMTTELCKMDLFDVIAEKGAIAGDSMVRYLFN